MDNIFSAMKPLNLFYEEPDPDRWMLFDHYPRKLVRRLIRGVPKLGGQKRVFLNLCAGLNHLGISFRINDYRYAKNHPEELACIIGKPFLLDKLHWENPILFGPAIYSHPIDDPTLLERLPIQKILVPGRWMMEMCRPYWGHQVDYWPVGIDTQRWAPLQGQTKNQDFLLYVKVLWDKQEAEASLVNPIRKYLNDHGLTFLEIVYGQYREEDFLAALGQCKAMIFLCEHETQGIAYQQALSCGVPILAWDRGGPWQDPVYYPDRVIFEPVTSVPYWDERCGLKFTDAEDFKNKVREFLSLYKENLFSPRDFILEDLTLDKSAQKYLENINNIQL